MTKLEWCRANAPDFYKDFSDDELLTVMSDLYDKRDKFKSIFDMDSSKVIKVYHGTKDPDFKPNFNYKNPNNDYGSGLYLTPYLSRAKEWSMSYYTKGEVGYAFEYDLDLSNLEVLDLDSMDSLYWITLLLTHRELEKLPTTPFNTLQKLKKKYYIDISKYDVIKGWRADDSYYSYAKSFIYGSLYRETLDKALREGNLGAQYCIKTKKAFDALTFITRHSASEYDAKNFLDNDRQARRNYAKLCESQEEGHVVYSYL